jgi:Protein of unknown function (DUF2844)
MRRMSGILLSLLGFMVVAVFSVQQAEAALGGSADSVTTDRKALSAAHRSTTTRAGYTIQEIASDATTVREYVSTTGVVFAVAWNGLMHPDLTTLLGSYSGEYQTALRKTSRKHGLRRQHVQSEQIVVEKWGHMRNLQGRAYVPALIPAGVTSDEIK